MPARDRQVAAAAVAAARAIHHHVVAPVRKQLQCRPARIGIGEHAQLGLGHLGRGTERRQLARLQQSRRRTRHALLQQQQGRLQLRVGRKTALHGAAKQEVGERQQAHALVMGHEGTDGGAGLAARQPGRREVHGLVHAVATFHAHCRQLPQVFASRRRRDHQRERRRIGRNHAVFRQSALQAQARHAEGAVLIVEMHVHRVVTGFGNAPGQAARISVLDLSRHGCLVRFIEQGAREVRHHQQRHQVFEHRAAPRQQHRLAGGAGQQPAEREPAFLRQPSLRDADEAGQARFGREQVVEAGVEAPVLHVVADGQQMPIRVVEEQVFDFRELFGLGGEAGDQLHALGRTRLRQCDQVAQNQRPVVAAQTGDITQARHAIGERRSVNALPGRQVLQVLQQSGDLVLQGKRPGVRFGRGLHIRIQA